MESDHIRHIEKRFEGRVTRVRDRLESFRASMRPGERGRGRRKNVDGAGEGVLKKREETVRDQ